MLLISNVIYSGAHAVLVLDTNTQAVYHKRTSCMLELLVTALPDTQELGYQSISARLLLIAFF
jgi:hypothetical protein